MDASSRPYVQGGQWQWKGGFYFKYTCCIIICIPLTLTLVTGRANEGLSLNGVIRRSRQEAPERFNEKW